MKRDLIIGLIGTAVVVAAGVSVLRWQGNAPVAPASSPEAAAPPTAAPTAPSAAPSAVAIAPSFDVVRVNPQGGLVVAGRAAPGADVTVLDGDKVVGRVTADANGEWVLIPADKLPPGTHQLGLSAESPAGGAARKSDGVVAMVVPEGPQPQASGALAVLVPRAGGGAAMPLQLPSDAVRRNLALDVIEYDSAGHVQILGRAEPRSRIQVFLDDQSRGRGAADAAGGWSATLDGTVPVGHHRLGLEAVGEDDRLLARLNLAFERVATAEGYASVDVQPGNNLWRIAQHSYGDGLRYAEIYQANRARIRDPNLIYPGQVIAVPAKQ